MAKILIITPESSTSKSGGGIIINRNIDLFKKAIGESYVYYIGRVRKRNLSFNMLCDRLRGVNREGTFVTIQNILLTIQEMNPELIFINSACCGLLTKIIGKKCNIPTLIFFHNIEFIFAYSEWKTRKLSFKSFLHAIITYCSEKKSVRYGSKLIMLNDRDRIACKKIYGREGDFLLPTSFTDQGSIKYVLTPKTYPLHLLFVGSNFFANSHGIKWFCKNVMPYLADVQLYIVGNRMEKERHNLESANVKVIGTVGELREWYEWSDLVISPIFIGSGMKTKTAEAMMFGVPILGTSEAFEGYEIDVGQIGGCCNTASEFVEKITNYTIKREDLLQKAMYSRKTFEEKYSSNILEMKLKLFINEEFL